MSSPSSTSNNHSSNNNDIIEKTNLLSDQLEQSWPSDFFDIEKTSRSYNNLVDKTLLESSLSLDNQQVKSSFNLNKDGFKKDVKKINEWLFDKFGEVPPYEENPEVIKYLLQMINNFDKSLEVHENLEFSYKLQSSEYSAESSQLQKELKVTGVSDKISDTLKDQINNLASTAGFLGTKDTQKVSLQLALTDYQISTSSFKDQISLYELENKKLNRLFSQIQTSNVNLTKKIAEFKLNRPQLLQKTKQWERDINILNEKSLDYQTKIQNLEKIRDSSQVDNNLLRLQNLKDLKAEIENKYQHLSKLDNEISSYNQLPPDLHLATLQLERAKSEEARLKKIKEDLVSRIVPDY